MTPSSSAVRRWQTPVVIMLGGALVLMLSSGTRQAFGLFLHPMTDAHGWGREVYAFAVALATLVLGAATPFMGALADRYGSGRVVLLGGVLWVVGLYAMAHATTPAWLALAAGLPVGLGAACTSVSIAMGAVGRQVPEAMRSRALGVVASAAAVGQMLVLPLAQGLIHWLDWRLALTALGGLMVLLIPAALGISGRPAPDGAAGSDQGIVAAIHQAVRHRGYLLLNGGFFVCGFHVSFIAVHLPSFVVDSGLSPAVGATALFLIGLFNIGGSYAWAHLGDRHRKKRVLSTLYLLRAGLIAVFWALPVSAASVLGFSALMGFLWLGTVPLTSGLVGEMFGVRYLSTLFGGVFFSHQMGAFAGAWLGGIVYDRTQSYDLMWGLAIALGIAAALLHAPIDDRNVHGRVAPQEAA